MGILILKVFLEQLLPLLADSIVQASEVQHEVEHIIACDDSAVPRNGPLGLEIAHPQIILEEIGAVVDRLPGRPHLLGNHVQSRCLAGAVPAVQNRNRLEIQHSQTVLRQHLKGIEAVIAGPLYVHQKAVLQLDVRERKM